MTKLSLILILTSCALAQDQGGLLQFDWNKIAAKAANKVNVTLEGPMLQLASQFLSNDQKDESQVKQLIQGLKGVYVRTFEFDKEGQYSDADLSDLRAQLRTPEWSKIVDTEEKKESVIICMKTDGKLFQALAILSAEPKELSFIQIVGAIDPSMLGALSGKFGIPKMEFGPKSKAPASKKKND